MLQVFITKKGLLYSTEWFGNCWLGVSWSLWLYFYSELELNSSRYTRKWMWLAEVCTRLKLRLNILYVCITQHWSDSTFEQETGLWKRSGDVKHDFSWIYLTTGGGKVQWSVVHEFAGLIELFIFPLKCTKESFRKIAHTCTSYTFNAHLRFKICFSGRCGNYQKSVKPQQFLNPHTDFWLEIETWDFL